MAQDRTSGYDMLIQISEAEINNQLATAFLAGTAFPASMSVPLNTGGVTGTANIMFRTPTADLDRPRPKMGITLPFTNSSLQITAPISVTIPGLSGSITIVDDIEVVTMGSRQKIELVFTGAAPNVTVTITSAAALAPLLMAAGLTLVQAQNMVAGQVVQLLQTQIRSIDLSGNIDVIDDNDATTPFDIDVTTINDTTSADRDCIVVGVKMGSDSGGNINLATTNFIPAGSSSLVMMSNFWLLARAMRPLVAAQLGTDVSAFDTPLRLNRNISAPGGQGTLTALEATVVGNRIRVTGRATASGTGWSASSDFSFFLDLALANGEITITATRPTTDTHFSLEWWVWLTGVVLLGIIGAIVMAIVEAVADGIVNGLIADGFGTLQIPPVPLGPIGSGLSISDLILDDLELHCSIIKADVVPIKSQGSYRSSQPFAIDLDTGAISAAQLSSSDLVWKPGVSLDAPRPSGMTATTTTYGALGVVQVSRMPLSTQRITASAVPATVPIVNPAMPMIQLVAGVRTSMGRFAKIKAWRSAARPDELNISWTTYDTPVPKLELSSVWSIAERGEISEYITRDCEYCQSSNVRWQGNFKAKPYLMAYPIDFQWCLCGQVLGQGEGEITTSGSVIKYKMDGPDLQIEATELGQDIDCELCLSAIDGKGIELFKCIRFNKDGLQKNCRKCSPIRNYAITYLPEKEELINWRPLLSATRILKG